jgi:hypothetical protein
MPDEFQDENESSVIKELRQKAKRADDLEPEVATLRQENAILKAGVTDLSPAKQKALLAAHEGDLEPEALRKTATELGFIAEAPAEVETPQVPADEVAAHKRIQEATAAAAPSEAQVRTLNDELLEAKSAEEITAILRRQDMVYTD